MSSNVLSTRLPWQDRWAQPTLLQLLEPLKIQHRRLFEQLMAELAGFDQVDQVILWYGSAWNWTIQYQLRAEALSPAAIAAASLDPADDPQTLVYLVPRVETPIICIPLSDQIIEQLPMKRLNRFIRDGIKNAKCAVAIHWATWTPNSKAEVGFLTDLLKRKCKLIMGAVDKADKAEIAEKVKETGKGRGKSGINAKNTPVTLEEDAGQSTDVEHPPVTKSKKSAQGKTVKTAKAGKAVASAAKGKTPAKASIKPVKATKPVKSVKLSAKVTKAASGKNTAAPVKKKTTKVAAAKAVKVTKAPAKAATKVGKSAKMAKSTKPAKATKSAKPAKAKAASSSNGAGASRQKVATAAKTAKSANAGKTAKPAKLRSVSKSAGKTVGKTSGKRASNSRVAADAKRKR